MADAVIGIGVILILIAGVCLSCGCCAEPCTDTFIDQDNELDDMHTNNANISSPIHIDNLNHIEV